MLGHLRQGLLAYAVLIAALLCTLLAWHYAVEITELRKYVLDNAVSASSSNLSSLDLIFSPLQILSGGILISFLLAFITWWQTRNIAEYKRAAEARKRLGLVMEMTNDFIAFFNPDGGDLYINAAGRKMVGIEEQHTAMMKMADLYPSAVLDMINKQAIPAAIHKGMWQGESILLHRNGREIAVTQTVFTHKNPNGAVEFFSTIAHDITERKQTEQRLSYLAQYDTLTGLPNRNLFHDRLAQGISRATRNEQMMALMFLDLDRFKHINDTMGHAVGDQLLKGVAEKLKLCLREVDTVARLSGDEFTIILEEVTSAQQVATVARKILESFSHPHIIGDNEIYVTLSIGITLYPLHAANVETMLKRADVAMYYAKEQGRNNYQFYTPRMEASPGALVSIDDKLKQALNKEELVLYYQPQIDVKTGQLMGIEALLRWKHPELGLVAAKEFIGLAEETGLIIPIGEWVLQSVGMQCKAWQEARLGPLRININLSARQFKQPNIVKLMENIIAQYKLAPGCLGVEIGGAVLMEDAQSSAHVVARLRTLGVHISLVDLDMAHLPLNYLKQFHVHSLKIDQSAVSDIPHDPHDVAIATSMMITQAHNQKLKVIAEGVETEEQLTFIRDHGCDGVQGYLLSQPLSAQDLRQLLQQMKTWKPGLDIRQWIETKALYSMSV